PVPRRRRRREAAVARRPRPSDPPRAARGGSGARVWGQGEREEAHLEGRGGGGGRRPWGRESGPGCRSAGAVSREATARRRRFRIRSVVSCVVVAFAWPPPALHVSSWHTSTPQSDAAASTALEETGPRSRREIFSALGGPCGPLARVR